MYFGKTMTTDHILVQKWPITFKEYSGFKESFIFNDSDFQGKKLGAKIVFLFGCHNNQGFQ